MWEVVMSEEIKLLTALCEALLLTVERRVEIKEGTPTSQPFKGESRYNGDGWYIPITREVSYKVTNRCSR
jgi:hypothetical protein